MLLTFLLAATRDTGSSVERRKRVSESLVLGEFHGEGGLRSRRTRAAASPVPWRAGAALGAPSVFSQVATGFAGPFL